MARYLFRENGTHYNGGSVFFGYGYTADGEPRFSMVRKYFKKGDRRGTSEDEFYVDGEKVLDYTAGVVALEKPPVFTDREKRALLDVIRDEPSDIRKKVPWDVTMGLTNKGAIEWGPPGYCKRTVRGREAVANKESS